MTPIRLADSRVERRTVAEWLFDLVTDDEEPGWMRLFLVVPVGVVLWLLWLIAVRTFA